MIELFLAGVWGYLLGAVPTGVLVTRAMRGVDVREQGSGHTGGLNVARAAGLGGGALTGVIDLLLGVAAVAGAGLLADNIWAATAAGVMAIVGHNWSVFIRFGGGIGLSTLAGSLLALAPLPVLEALIGLILLWAILVMLIHFHRARATVVAMALIGPLLWALGIEPHAVLIGLLGGLIVIVKTMPDWNRKYD